jgi:hypothetical protein
VIKAAGEVKSAAYLTQIHSDMVEEVSLGNPDRCLGFLMDGTAANRKSLKELEALFPQAVGFICQAHR